MGVLEIAGCAMIAFGPPFSMFIFVIAQDPLRIILFVAGKAERGLEKVSAQGMHIEGVHSLKNAKHTTALVCGLGFGFMAGAFSLVNVLADGIGPGTVGLPTKMNLTQTFVGDHTFFVTSAVLAAAFVLLHVVWNVLFWHGFETQKYYLVAVVIVSHFLVSGLTLLNKLQLYAVSITVAYIVLAVLSVGSFFVAGGTVGNVGTFFKQLFTWSFPPPPPSAENNNVAGPANQSSRAPASASNQ